MFQLTLTDLVVRRRGKLVLGPIALSIEKGGPMMIIGLSGSGKTTLLRVMHGIKRVSDGMVSWAHPDQENHAYVLQIPLVLRRSVAEKLSYPLQLLKTPKAQIQDAGDYSVEPCERAASDAFVWGQQKLGTALLVPG